jgi:Fur family ferric uptake transcriptional regulator
MSKYMTSQRRLLLDYLASHPDDTLRVSEICNALMDSGISKSAVYRNLAALEADGEISRVSRQGVREAFYRYSHAEHCRDCLHLNCRRCGKTYHMEKGQTEILESVLSSLDSFSLDRSATVLYGVCKECNHKKTDEEMEK